MSTSCATVYVPATVVTPNLFISDSLAAYWVAQVTLRLRREVAWCWHQRARQFDPDPSVLPPLADAATENLDLVRYRDQKNHFLKRDPTARYLGDQIAALEPKDKRPSRWASLVESLDLDGASQFVLALGLASRLDAGLAPIFSTCMNDLARPFPTLALAQRLWDEPSQIVECADPNHPIYRYGLLANINDPTDALTWQRPLDMSAVVTQQLSDPDAALPQGVSLLTVREPRSLDRSAELLVARLLAKTERSMQIVPLLGPRGVPFGDWAATLGQRMGCPVVAVDSRSAYEQHGLLTLASVCWLRKLDLMLPEEWAQTDRLKDHVNLLSSTQSIPLRWYVPINEQSQQDGFPAHAVTPAIRIQGLSFEHRVRKFTQCIGGQAAGMQSAIEECARRFRFQERTIEDVAKAFADNTIPITSDALVTACGNETVVELGNLVQLVSLRFGPDELVLPEAQAQQFQEIIHAMQTLTIVHYHWGTARAWNESGLSVLFCGSPGTGKTMAAEVLAESLGLPMYRVDISQVTSKYVGETEKNLKRIFDAAEVSDCVLFFDEADALFGKRTEVKDAHDRFANIEISYLLERMERFKGLAILSTNRRNDLDEGFMRRLRYILEFPVPGFEQRKKIWQLVFPLGLDVSDIDFHYLAKQFQLTGGHIRSIAINACLRSADANHPDARGRVLMRDVLIAVKRELEKMNRSANDELFGAYSNVMRERTA